MAISSKDLESLWQRYKVEAVPAGISVNQFFESNGVPYHVFEKWYKKKYQAPNVVECVVAGAPNSISAVPAPSKLGNPSNGLSPVPSEDAVVIKYVNLGLSNGMKIEHRNMRGGYDKLCGVIRSLGEDPEDGTAYVFTSKNQKVVKIIRHEHNECQMYYQKFDKNMSFVRLEFEGVLPIYVLEWKYLVAMLSCPVVKSIGPIELKCYEDAA